MRAGIDLQKIVHGFLKPEAVLFEFARQGAAPIDVYFRAPYIMKRFNQLGELDECPWI
jgi:hypothetical protein